MKGFTLVETLVAISVLMIAIAGPLVVASRGLTAAVYSRDQMTATYLAQESMEFLKNFRDNNLHNSTAWLSTAGSPAFNLIGNCTPFHSCDADALDASLFSNSGIVSCPTQLGASPPAPCQLFALSNGYVHSSSAGGTATQFYRHFYIDSTVSNSVTTEVVAHVVVDWNEGTIPYEIDLASELLNTTR